LGSFSPSKKLAPNDPLARYIFSKTHFKAQKNEVLAAAFMPLQPPKKAETSVSQIKGLSERQIWVIGEKIGKKSQRNLKARAEIIIDIVNQSGLAIDPDRWFGRHANIVGWPEKKSEQMNCANKLALAAKLKLPP
jgi:hypothetical protein